MGGVTEAVSSSVVVLEIFGPVGSLSSPGPRSIRVILYLEPYNNTSLIFKMYELGLKMGVYTNTRWDIYGKASNASEQSRPQGGNG